MLRIFAIFALAVLTAACGSAETPASAAAPASPSRILQSHASAGDASTATAAADAPADQPAQSPEDFVREFFEGYYAGLLKDQFWLDKPVKLSVYFDSSLVERFQAKFTNCEEDSDEICGLDFDPIIAAQDFDDTIPDLRVERVGSGSPVEVKLAFDLFGKPQTMTYTLVQVDGAWRIHDIRSSDYGSLVELLSGSGSDAPSTSMQQSI